MTVQITRRGALRAAAIVGVSVGMGAAAFFGGQATRMSDEAHAAKQNVAVHTAVTSAVKSTKQADAKVLDTKLHELAAKAERHERKAVRNARRATRANERKRAERLANEAYSNGSSAGYSSGHDQGKQEGYNEGAVDGYITGLFEGFDY